MMRDVRDSARPRFTSTCVYKHYTLWLSNGADYCDKRNENDNIRLLKACIISDKSSELGSPLESTQSLCTIRRARTWRAFVHTNVDFDIVFVLYTQLLFLLCMLLCSRSRHVIVPIYKNIQVTAACTYSRVLVDLKLDLVCGRQSPYGHNTV